MPEGIIYITRTPQDRPNYYKVGRTTQSTTEERTHHQSTYLSERIKTIKEYRVTNDIEAEVAAHRALADVKVNLAHAREIFELSIDSLIERVELAIKPWLIEEIQNNPQNDWILDFLSQPDFRIANYHHNDLEINQKIKLIIEFMMRIITRGASPASRLIDNKPYEKLINDFNIGTYLLAALKNINHQELVNIENWQKKFEVILYLSKAPLVMSINEHGNYEWPRLRRDIENLKSGLKGFNINEVIHHWSENYFSSNPKLIMGCYKFLDHQVHKWNSRYEQLEDVFVRGAKNSVYSNAMKYCINYPNRNSKEVHETTNQIINHYGVDWINENLEKKLVTEFNSVRAIIEADDKRYRDSLWAKADEKKLPVELCLRFVHEEISLDEAIEIHETVSQIKWVKKIKKGEGFIIEDSESIIPLSDIYNGKLDIEDAINKNLELKYERKKEFEKEKEFKKRLDNIKEQYKLDKDIIVDRQLGIIKDKLFKIFRSLKTKDTSPLKELNYSDKTLTCIEDMIKKDIKAYTRIDHFKNAGQFGFSYLTKDNFTLTFSLSEQYILWKGDFPYSNPETYAEEDDIIIEFINNLPFNSKKNG